MIDSCKPFLGDVIAKVGDEEKVADTFWVREVVLDDSYLLGGQKYTWSIEEEIKCVFGHSFGSLGIKGRNVGVHMEEIFMSAAEELEFALVVDLGKSIDPIHWSYNYQYSINYVRRLCVNITWLEYKENLMNI